MADPLDPDLRYLTYVGTETDLIFNHGTDLPEFSLYPLIGTGDGRKTLRRYSQAQITIAARHGLGAILETATWKANADRAAPLGYDSAALDRINAAAVDLLRNVADEAQSPVVVSGNIGPRGDGYAPGDRMDADTAQAYHARQIGTLTGADMIGASTLTYVAEAIGIARAAAAAGIPHVLSFTVETDGRLPDGADLPEAIAACDAATGASAAYYMINCAHPDHFDPVLDGAPWQARLKGLVVNASRCSHAELDEAECLDPGDPAELAGQLAALAERHPHLRVFGGCCGTDARHLEAMATALGAT